MTSLLTSIFFTFERIGVFALVVDQLLTHDVPMFLAFLAGYSVAFYCTLFVAYPAHVDEEVGVTPQMNDPMTAAKVCVGCKLQSCLSRAARPCSAHKAQQRLGVWCATFKFASRNV